MDNICQTCGRNNGNGPCVIDHMTEQPILYPEPLNHNKSNCVYYNTKPEITIPNISQYLEGTESEIKYIDKMKDNIDKMEKYEPHIEEFISEEEIQEKKSTLTKEEYEEWKKNTLDRLSKSNVVEYVKNVLGLNDEQQKEGVNYSNESMLDGETCIGWFNQVTSWKRVMNAARRTIGKKPLDKEPSPSWKAKILLAEHSPIRLLEYDWGWEKIRQWVTVHLVRHHIGVEKFVHSQRSDRRELPCDRDHIYQGAKNDMDMTANAQGLINMSRKRCCNCASKETRAAWKMVLDELEKKDPVLRSKCVRECVYRGFCPEWMSKCGYYKTDEYKKELAAYRCTKFGDDIKYYGYHKHKDLSFIISNTGHIYTNPACINGPISNKEFNEPLKVIAQIYNDNTEPRLIYPQELKYSKENYYTGKEVIIEDLKIPVASLVLAAFSDQSIYIIERQRNELGYMFKGEYFEHIDGNIWNNDIDNLKLTNCYDYE